jgi:drug/metabolite transporter (DMT)-like permease
MTAKTGLLLLNAAILLWGITPLFAKLIDLPVLHVICYRSLIAACCLLVYLQVRSIRLRLHSGKDTLIVLATGVLMGIHWVTYFTAIRLASVAVGVIALCTTPIMTILLEPLFNRERLHLRDLATGAAVLIGVIVLMPDLNLANQVTCGILAGIFSALLFSIRNIISRRLVRRYESSLMMFYQIVTAGVMLLPFTLLQPATFTVRNLGLLLLLGTVFTALAHSLYIGSLTGLRAKTAAIMQNITPVYSALFAALLIGEIPSTRTLAGGSIVLLAALYETCCGRKS